MRWITLVLCLCTAQLGAQQGSALAAAAPPQLFNKTIRASFQIDYVTKAPDGSTHNPRYTSQRLIYISTAGRIFARVARRR